MGGKQALHTVARMVQPLTHILCPYEVPVRYKYANENVSHNHHLSELAPVHSYNTCIKHEVWNDDRRGSVGQPVHPTIHH